MLASIEFAEVHAPAFYGADIEAAQEAIVALFLAKNGPAGTNPVSDETLRLLRDLLEAHLTTDGVLFDSRAWIVTARRSDGRE